MEKISACIIGLGRIASLLEEDTLREKPCTHAGAIAADPDCLLAGGCDTDGERRRLFADKWQVPGYKDAETMLAAQKADIVVIATHPDSHAFYCALAAAHKVSVVICEKPLAGTIAQARSIAALEKNGMRIVTNHERRYSADYIKAKAILDEGKLGRLLSVSAALYMGKNQRLIDVLWHDGTHLADAMMFLSGGILRHKKSWGAKLTGSTGTAWLGGYLEGVKPSVPFVIELGAGRDHLVFEMEFSCERGRLRIGNGIFEVWESGPSPYAEKFCSLKKTEEGFTGPTGYFSNMVKDAVDCVRYPNRRPLSCAADGLRVIEYLNSVKRWK
jgi:predicted dehydrogenase